MYVAAESVLTAGGQASMSVAPSPIITTLSERMQSKE